MGYYSLITIRAGIFRSITFKFCSLSFLSRSARLVGQVSYVYDMVYHTHTQPPYTVGTTDYLHTLLMFSSECMNNHNIHDEQQHISRNRETAKACAGEPCLS